MFHSCELYLYIEMNVKMAFLKMPVEFLQAWCIIRQGISMVGQNVTISLGEGGMQTGIFQWIHPELLKGIPQEWPKR